MTAPAGVSRRAVILVVAVVAAFTASVDLSIVNLALPTLGAAFGTSQSELAWSVNAYVLPYAVSILAVGRLGDRFGHRRVLAAGAALFAAGSFIAAAAPSYAVLLAGRVLQGLGGSALLTIALALVSIHYPGPERPRALGWYFSAGAAAAVIGPVVGGVLATAVGWRGIFWSQLPLALLVLVMALVALPAPAEGRRRSLDAPGLALGTLALVGVNVALLQANAWGWGSPPILTSWAVAAVALVAFGLRERSAPEPAVRLSVFRSRLFVASVFVGGAVWFGIMSGSIQLSTYLQSIRGLDPTQAALVFLPWPLMAGLLFPRSGAVVARFGAERTMIASLAIAMVAAVGMIAFDRTTPLVVVSLVAAIGGAPIAFGVTASTVSALAEFPPDEAGIASGVYNGLRQIGSALGVAVPAAAFDLVAARVADPMAGSTIAFATRAVAYGAVVLLVAVLLVRPRRMPAAGPVAPPAR